MSQQHVHGFGVEERLARVLGRQAQWASRRRQYDDRLAQVRHRSHRHGGHYLAVLLTDQINVLGGMSGAIQALEDLGYRRLPLDGEARDSRLGSTLMVPISTEAFGRLNPELLVIMNSYATAAGPDQEQAARATLEKLLPGWDRFMKPAREGRVLFLDARKVTTPSVQSALHTLEAIAAWRGTRAPD